MSHSERKNYRARKKAKKYLKRAYLFDTIVVIAALNIFGSYISIFISLPYFICSLIASLAVIAIAYKAASYCEKIAGQLLKNSACKCNIKVNKNKSSRKNNIIRVDFTKKRIKNNEEYSVKIL